MRRAALLATLVALGCGGRAGSAYGSFSLALDGETAGRIDQLQVELVSSSSFDCGQVQSACFNSLGIAPVPFAGAEAGHKVYRAPFTMADGGTPIDLEVTPGTYDVVVEALDAGGKLVANACTLSVAFAPGADVNVDLTLLKFAGASCDASM